MGEKSVLEARELVKRYRKSWALRGINVSLPAGGVTGLVGPNAAGKSTLIRTWVGFEKPTEGSAFVYGHDSWTERPAALAKIGYVAQAPRLYDGLTVSEHVKFAKRLRSSFDVDLALQHLERVRVPLDRKGRQLSGGQQAQVALSIALGTRSPVLLLDEPLASLDPLARREFLGIVSASVKEHGTTVVLSSHVVTDIEQACDRLLVLGIGHVLLNETIDSVLDTHSAMEGGSVEPNGVVASFDGPRGLTTVCRHDPERRPAGYRAATLEEIVLASLSSARETADEAAQAA